MRSQGWFDFMKVAMRMQNEQAEREGVESAKKVKEAEEAQEKFVTQNHYEINRAMQVKPSAYIIDYEIWAGASLIGWGNTTMTTTGEVSANDLLTQIQNHCKDKSGAANPSIRVVGLFKL